MFPVFVFFFVFVLVGTLMMVYLFRSLGAAMGLTVLRDLRSIQLIYEQNKIPESWFQRYAVQSKEGRLCAHKSLGRLKRRMKNSPALGNVLVREELMQLVGSMDELLKQGDVTGHVGPDPLLRNSILVIEESLWKLGVFRKMIGFMLRNGYPVVFVSSSGLRIPGYIKKSLWFVGQGDGLNQWQAILHALDPHGMEADRVMVVGTADCDVLQYAKAAGARLFCVQRSETISRHQSLSAEVIGQMEQLEQREESVERENNNFPDSDNFGTGN